MRPFLISFNMENLPEKIRTLQKVINTHFETQINQTTDKKILSGLKLHHSECKKIIIEIKRNLNEAETYGGVSQLIQAIKTKQLNIFEIN